MPKLRVHNLTVSLDGYVAGPDQTVETPLGTGGESLHEWMFKTRFGAAMFGGEGEDGIDNDYASRFGDGIGAYIMGRNMFGPVRGPWPTDPDDALFDWRGWWGEDPPYHCDVFVLTHYERPSLVMEGGNTFHFVQGDARSVRDRAVAAAGGLDVQVGGGASTVRQFLRAGLIDEMHYVIAPKLLGSGEPLFGDGIAAGYEVVETVASPAAVHVRLRRSDDATGERLTGD